MSQQPKTQQIRIRLKAFDHRLIDSVHAGNSLILLSVLVLRFVVLCPCRTRKEKFHRIDLSARQQRCA